MRIDIRISDIQFKAAGPNETRRGLHGWISCILNGRVLLDGLTLRRTRSGRTTLSFPSRLDKSGRKHFYIRPLDNAARRVIERQVLQALNIRERSA